MYRFQGVKVTRERFWELAELAKDLAILEEELDKEMGLNVEKKLIAELVEELKKQEFQKEQELLKEKENQEIQKENTHNFHSSKRSFRHTFFRKSKIDSDFEDENALMV